MKRSLTALVLLSSAALSARAAADPAALFRKIPAPPKTLASAGARVRLKAAPEPRFVAPAYDAAMKAVTEQAKAKGLASGQAQADEMGAGIDVARMQSDPAYAQRVQAKMASMTMAQKMAMAQRFQEAQSGAGRPLQARIAEGELRQSIAELSRGNRETLARIGTMIRKAEADEDAAHRAVDARIDAALVKCPDDPNATVIEMRLPACADPLIRRARAEHTAAAAKALAAAGAVYRRAWALAKARVDAEAPLQAKAKSAGDANDAAQVAGAVDEFSHVLIAFARRATLRAAFWGQPGLFAAPTSSRVDFWVSAVKGGKDTAKAVAWPPSDPDD